jgi:hypothetical protein
MGKSNFNLLAYIPLESYILLLYYYVADKAFQPFLGTYVLAAAAAACGG